jgi:hypothetical protein
MPLRLNSASGDLSEVAEARMREALGLDNRPFRQSPQKSAGEIRHRRQFVQDGEVPVVVANRHREQGNGASAGSRLAKLQTALEAERMARTSAERALQEAQATIQNLETRLAHAELGHGEALAAERARREQVEKALQQAMAARDAVERQLRQAECRQEVAEPARKRGRPKKAASSRQIDGAPSAARKLREPQPVKWWLPSYRAKLQKRR